MLGRRQGQNSPEQLSLMLIGGTRNLQLKQVKSGTRVEKMVARWPWLQMLPSRARRDGWGVKQLQGTWSSILAWGDPLTASPDPRWASTAWRGQKGNQVPHCSGEKHRDISQNWNGGDVMGRKCLFRVELPCICCLQISNVPPVCINYGKIYSRQR